MQRSGYTVRIFANRETHGAPRETGLRIVAVRQATAGLVAAFLNVFRHP
jgi:hypothetical protein